MFIVLSVFGAILQGGGGIAATTLNASINATDTTIPVSINGTVNFIDIDIIAIGDEQILYSAKDSTHLYVAAGGRGYGGTEAVYHALGATVYTLQASFINRMAGYNISVISDATGWWAAINIPIAILRLLVNAFAIDLSFLGTDLAIVSYLWMAMGIGALFTIGIYLAGGRRV